MGGRDVRRCPLRRPCTTNDRPLHQHSMGPAATMPCSRLCAILRQGPHPTPMVRAPLRQPSTRRTSHPAPPKRMRAQPRGKIAGHHHTTVGWGKTSPVQGIRVSSGEFDSLHARPQPTDSPTTTTKPISYRERPQPRLHLRNSGGSAPSNALATASASHAATTRLAQRHPSGPAAHRGAPSNRWPAAAPPGARHTAHVVQLWTGRRMLAPRPWPTHFDAHRVAFVRRDDVSVRSAIGRRQRISHGPHAESHVRTGDEETLATLHIRSCRIPDRVPKPAHEHLLGSPSPPADHSRQ
jgi:hypothetical protein